MTRPYKKRPAALTVIAVLVILATSGCAPDSLPDSRETSHPIETNTPAPEASAGDIITAEEAAEMNAAWGRATDDKAYRLPGGEYVLIKGGQPLPENVEQAVQGTVTPPLVTTYSTPEFNAANKQAANDAIAAQEAATGRTAVVVIHAMNAVGASGSEARWSAGIGSDSYNGTSKEEAIAFAQKWIDQSPNTRILIVVDALG